MKLTLDKSKISLETFENAIFEGTYLEIADDVYRDVEASHRQFIDLFEKNEPIYGVNTGFGKNCQNVVSKSASYQLQDNLISYLSCGMGDNFGPSMGKATLLARIISLAKGYSGVSRQLIEHMVVLLNKKIYPLIPKQGSLGASGDLIPLAYVGNIIRATGQCYYDSKIRDSAEVYRELNLTAYKLGPKEGLALVNGTSAMCAIATLNIARARRLINLSMMSTAWLNLIRNDNPQSFSPLVNEKAKSFSGQTKAAREILRILTNYELSGAASSKVGPDKAQYIDCIQPPYSIRCAPQILGPIIETLRLNEQWIEEEINGASDNPLIDMNGKVANGGNFYGGYIAHGMDYLKISLANLADMLDRQLTLLMDEKSDHWDYPNLIDGKNLKPEERSAHHGLKGLHQLVSALTSEIMAQATPGSIYSRSSESHNQDKVSLGMSCATQLSKMLDDLGHITSAYLTCLAQAIDLKKIKIKDEESLKLYLQIRKNVAFVKRDRPLDQALANLNRDLFHCGGT